jgi:hypothetical protein
LLEQKLDDDALNQVDIARTTNIKYKIMNIESWIHGKKAWVLFVFIFITRLGWLGLYSYVDSKMSSPSLNMMYENGDIAENLLRGQGFSLSQIVS